MPEFAFETTGLDIVAAFPDQVAGKSFLITGPSVGGLGAEAALSLATGKPAALLLVGRSSSNCKAVVDMINSRAPATNVAFIQAEFGDFGSVRAAAEEILRLGYTIDGIIGNAAIMAAPYAKTEDDIESQFQINYLSHFLLINSLLEKGPQLEKPSVVLLGSSASPQTPFPTIDNFENYNFSGGSTYHPLDGYALSKTANILFAKSLAGRDILAFSVNPGNIKTNLQKYLSPEMIGSWIEKRLSAKEQLPAIPEQKVKSLQQGCATALRALLDPSLRGQSGSFLDDCQVVHLPQLDSAGESLGENIWKLSESLVGQKFRLS